MKHIDDRANEASTSKSAASKYASSNGVAPDAAASPASAPAQPRRRWPRRVAIVLTTLAVLLFVCAAAFLVYASDYYHAGTSAQAALTSTPEIPVAQGDGFVAFGDPDASAGIVLYPGAKVEYTAYAPLARELAKQGYFTVITEMPFNFAFFGIDAADRVRDAYPQVKSWWVGGHSLGGSMAAQYAATHASDPALAGLVLLGAYTASDLSATDLGIISVYGSNDQVLNRSKMADSAPLLPPDARTVEIPGGNHALFGDYGAQSGDGVATITHTDQQLKTASIVDAYLTARENPNPTALPAAA
ncbi:MULTISPECIES: alpha/beta fold hydrolase [Gordonibacter]|uniref:Alpha/beta hydrolase n=1 Tax=Gordonibacter faecis TaxID=3047475 RepID=A0ABT7DNP2_9ACTN|nr:MULTISPECIES: alpha/beta fold hydrolase [unclassified Gordonibacter]MDJ1649775.1 alpha/beta hydrolase [Gordonibacter sp. KGMB12511]HIW75441.1 alpha/beta hydrolase [Candidatus Gordonibacter avicola]